jgi:uncharacterized protein (UPF0332 family)
MPLHKEELIKLAVKKSQTALESAQANINIDKLETASNRIYYAIFYIVTALAYKYDFKTSKHSKLMAWFNKKFIYEDKIFNNKIYHIYEEAFMFRQKSDYDLTYIPDIAVIKDLLSDTRYFVDTISKVI